ncbi:MAG: peptidylprolyl isomerase, partial [Candidatus Marinimicrobia bacterium]|nr:peptidylprolyl isomerase [Candidatus Neomarinimicrobiota bacterium]
VYYMLQNYPPQFIQANEPFQTDGQFDPAKYFQALNNPAGNEWAPVENYLAELLPGEKLNQLVRATAFTSEEEIKAGWLNKSVRATIDYIYVPYSAINTDSLDISDADIKRYYRKEKESFAAPETRVIEYAVWPKTPTANDTAATLETARELAERARAGEDFAQLAIDYSQDPGSGPAGGELGWFGKGQMVPEFEEAAFAAEPGEVVGPVKTQFGYHIIKVSDKKIENDTEQVLASHILLNVELSPQGLSDLRSLANIFSFDAADSSFETALRIHDMSSTRSSPLKIDDRYLPQPVAGLRSAVRFVFQSEEVGAISDVYQNDNCYLVARLAEINPAGYRPLEDVTGTIRQRLRQNMIKEYATALFAGVSDEIQSGEWQSAADAIAETRYFTGVTSTLDGSFTGIGRSAVLAGIINMLEPGESTGLVELEGGIAKIKLVDRTKPDWSEYDTEREAAHEQLLSRQLQTAWSNYVAGLKENAEIIDNRHRFY